MSDHKRENVFVCETTDLALVTVWVLVILPTHDNVVFCVPKCWLCSGICPVSFRVVTEHPSDDIVRLPFAKLLVRLVLFCTIGHDRPQFSSWARNFRYYCFDVHVSLVDHDTFKYCLH